MKMKKKIKRGIAALSAAVMFLGLLPLTPDNTITVQAAGNEPSLAAYASKDQLMDNTFAPKADGTANNVCKIAFGHDENRSELQWYVLGKDDGVNGDNTVIFAASSLLSNQYFKVPDEYDLTECDYGGKTVSSVYNNHYGASTVRNTMKEMAANESYFSLAEQSLMNTTKITSYDAKNKLTYTTEDKLYLLMGYSVNDGETMQKQIYAGSRDQIVLSFNKYWSQGTDFFLRGTWDTNITCASLYKGMEGVGSNNQYASADIRPALNLKLTDGLFASVRRPAEGTTTVSKDSPMILRLDGTGKNIGTVTYNAETKVITTNKDTAASGAVYLMVLGKHNGTDTIYCATIAPGTAKVNTSTASWLADVDLSTCKIWLETVSDGMLYAVTATPEPTALEQISSVEVTIDPPTAGNWLAANAACATTGVSNTKPVLTWTPNDDSVVGGKEYTASVRLTAASGYEFTDSTTATVNGEQATATKNGDGTLTVTHSFTAATVKDKLKEIIASDPVTAPNGMFYWKIEELLPKTVDIMLENQTVTSASVTWDITPLKNEYDATELTEQRVTLTGTVTCPDTVDANGIELTTSITVIISGSGSTTPIQISNVDVTIPAPVPGSPIPTYVDATCAQEGVSCTAMGWTPNDKDAQWETQYGVTVMLKAPSGYEFTNSTTATVNGEAATKVRKEENFGNLYVSYEFARTPAAPGGKDKLRSITTPATITVANGTAADEIIKKLPATVGIETANKTVASATVTWDTEPLKKVYSPSETEQQGITLTGDVICPETVDAGDVQLYISITIMISAAGASPATPTPAPVTPTPAPATSAPATPAPETPAPASYYIMDGANSSWVRNEDGSMAIRGNGEISKFTGVKVDGVLIDPANYIVTEGSTIITLKPEYLNTLSEGSHSFEILWADGSAATDFTVTGNAADYIAVNAPQTGYDSHITLWTLLLLAALSGLAAISITKKSKVNQ